MYNIFKSIYNFFVPPAPFTTKQNVPISTSKSIATKVDKLEQEALEAKKKIERIHDLVYIGFLVIVLMTATIIISLGVWLISGNNSNFEKIYEFQNINMNNFNNEQSQIDNLKYQNKLLKDCLLNGGWKACLIQN